MFMTSILYEPWRHQVVETDFAKFLRRELNDNDLMTYYHRQTKNWVIGAWLDGGKKILELVFVGPEPCFSRRHYTELKSMLRGTPEHEIGVRRTKQHLREMQDDHGGLKTRQETVREVAETKKFLRKHVGAKYYDHPYFWDCN